MNDIIYTLLLFVPVILIGICFILLFWALIKKIKEDPSKAKTDLVGGVVYIIFMVLLISSFKSGFIIPIVIGIIGLFIFMLILNFFPQLLFFVISALIVALFIKLVLFFLSIL